jgi:hypothetical protein
VTPGVGEQGRALQARRMRLTVYASGHVEITYRDPITDETVTRRFSANAGDGTRSVYVVEHLPGGRTTQPCGALAATGDTLLATRASLPDVIRSEYRRMRRGHDRMWDSGIRAWVRR